MTTVFRNKPRVTDDTSDIEGRVTWMDGSFFLAPFSSSIKVSLHVHV